MDKIVSIVAKVPQKMRYDDDAADRMSHRYTSLILVVFAVMSTMQQYVGRPITCWVPKEFSGGWTKYTNNYCWVKNTYWLPLEHEIPQAHEPEKRQEIVYYQWVPFIFLGMAALFYMPCQVWRSFNSKSGVDSDNILDAASTLMKTDKVERRDRTIRLITNSMDRFLGNRSQLKTGCSPSLQACLSTVFCCVFGKKFGNYLMVLYFFVKLLYIANALTQLFMLNSLLQTQFNLYGVEVIQSLLDSEGKDDFFNSTVFPKVTMCDFSVRRLGNVQRYTVQCLLPINLYTEKMFVFIWFWIVLVITVTCLSLIMWALRALCADDKVRYVSNHLKTAGRVDKSDDALVLDFVQDYLRHDGVFIMRLVGHNTNAITTTDIFASLWDRWMESRPTPRKEPLPPPEVELGGSPSTLPSKGRHLDFLPLKPSAPSGLDQPDATTPMYPKVEEYDSDGEGVMYRPPSLEEN